MSSFRTTIDWAMQPWAKDLVESGVGKLTSKPCGLNANVILRASFARGSKFLSKIIRGLEPPGSGKFLQENPQPLSSRTALPTSPIHTILCETVDTRLAAARELCRKVLQEYLGRAEAGLHRAGERRSYLLVTNQE